ncbi:glycoside hydrolase family 75 protein [Streptomyces misionensis]|uniref:glycoside hydrolase family 75 protein n=1 Tax=Streptomyces misionensis TaxID=67331 RepID=UPI0021BD6B02|nr:glycoside hydrolase family 75 protein [Streptomyces misionensis]
MRVPTLTLAAVGAALIAPATLPGPAAALPPEARATAHGKGATPGAGPRKNVVPRAGAPAGPVPREHPPASPDRSGHRVGLRRESARAAVARREGAVTAEDLLARVGVCDQISDGRYRTDAGSPETVPVCGTRDAVFWKADLDIDCDGRPSVHCNAQTDPLYSPDTAFRQSDGRQLSAEELPYIVVPAAGPRWDPGAYGVRGGSVAAVVYRDRVQYAVVGDTGPSDLIGEASYATAKGLGISPGPSDGGAASGVTYIVFKDSRADPIEDHGAAVATGERLARQFVTDTGD